MPTSPSLTLTNSGDHWSTSWDLESLEKCNTSVKYISASLSYLLLLSCLLQEKKKTGTGDTGSKPRPLKAEGRNWGEEAMLGKMGMRREDYSRSITCEPSCCELSEMQTCNTATSGLSEIAACPLSPVADSPSALPSPTSSPSSSQQLFLPVHSMPAPVCQLLCCTTVLLKVLYCRIKNVFFIFRFIGFLCVIWVKSIINLWQHSTT